MIVLPMDGDWQCWLRWLRAFLMQHHTEIGELESIVEVIVLRAITGWICDSS